MHTKTKLVGAAAIVAALAAGGAAFTDSNTMPTNQRVGYGSVTVTGGTVDHIDYNINADDVSKLDGVTVWVTGDYTASTVSVQWNNTHAASPTYPVVTCTTGAYSTDTEFDCTAPINVNDAASLDVTITTTPKA